MEEIHPNEWHDESIKSDLVYNYINSFSHAFKEFDSKLENLEFIEKNAKLIAALVQELKIWAGLINIYSYHKHNVEILN